MEKKKELLASYSAKVKTTSKKVVEVKNVSIFATDLKNSIKFYEKIGFEVKRTRVIKNKRVAELIFDPKKVSKILVTQINS